MSVPSASPASASMRGPSSASRAPRPAKKPSMSVSAGGPTSHSVGGLVLSDVGLGGGRVEDGTAWSMVARFVCSVPGCGASFTRKQNLLRHQTQKHGRAKTMARGGAMPSSPPADDDMDSDDYNDDDDDDLPAFF